ncbi:MAG: type VI secretion protein ImpB [Ascidiaceihabitans sp.]|nr:type VI secretion protein ImpB [Ascidiaceihabitans sp.]
MLLRFQHQILLAAWAKVIMDQMRGKARGIERLYLDFDSFFASAEQHFNSSLRGKPVGVVPLDSSTTSCIAVSREAKALGVKSGARITDARAIVPDMIFVVARHDVYVRLHNRILDVIDTCLPISSVRSIDEVVCHLTASEAAEGIGLAQRIKAALAAAFSDGLTCSIGMAPTELLAKIGAEMHKPNGFALIKSDDLPSALNHLALKKLPGVSDGMMRRLNRSGVYNFADLWGLAPKQARAIWRSVEGERFWNGLHGYHFERPETVKSMFGHSRVLPKEWRNPERVKICARQLSLSASRRLRRANLIAIKLTLGFRGKRYGRDRTQPPEPLAWNCEAGFQPANDDHTFLVALDEALEVAKKTMKFQPNSVSVTIHGVDDAMYITPDLFSHQKAKEDTQQIGQTNGGADWDKVSNLMDILRSKHGPNAISLGPQDEIPGGYVGAKIAFGRIPEQDDFNSAPVADEDTHFCTH